MEIPPFTLERYFARYEFQLRFLLSCSDCEPLRQQELLELADSECAGLWAELKLAYTESQGHPLLREAIAELYPGVQSDEIVVAAPEEAIFLYMHAVLRCGDHVIVTAPAYQSLFQVAQDLGCELSFWEPVEHASGWRFEPEQLETLLRPQTKLLVVNFPHNPTGALLEPGEMEQLMELVRERDLLLFSDEMYRFLELDGRPALPAACTLHRRASSLGGLSKSFGLPGLRIGWLAAREEAVRRRVMELKDYTTICVSAPSEILAIIALRNRQRIVASHRERVRRNLRVLEGFLAEHSEWFSHRRPAAGSVCFPRVTGPLDAAELSQRLVTEFGVMLVPSSVLHFKAQHVRFGLGRDDLSEGLQRLRQALAAMS